MSTWLKKIITTVVLLSLSCFAIADPPESSGIVIRDEYNNAWVDIDMDTGLLAVTGVNIVQWCTDGAPFDTIYYADKNLQDGFRLNTLEKAEVTTSVWPFTVFDCALFTSVPPLATGVANYRLHDNDLFGNQFCEEKNNANAFGRKVNGKLYSPQGEGRNLNMHVWGIYDCETFTFRLFNVDIKLTGK